MELLIPSVRTSKNIKWIFDKLTLIISITIMSWLMMSGLVLADNHDVLDNANILNTSTEQYIYDVNNNQMNKIKGHPQISVITEKNIDGDIENEAQKLFNKYRLGTKGYDNGVLLLIDVDGHQVRMQTGYGIESAVPDDFVNELMNDSVKSEFRQNNYSAGTKMMVNKLVDRITSHQKDLRSKSDVNNHQAAIEAAQQEEAKEQKELLSLIKISCLIIVILFVVGFATITLFREIKKYKLSKSIEMKFNKIISQVKNVMAEQNISVPTVLTLKGADESWIAKKELRNQELSSKLTTLINLYILDDLIRRQDSFSLLSASKDTSVFEIEIVNILSSLNVIDWTKPLPNYQEVANNIIGASKQIENTNSMLDETISNPELWNKFRNNLYEELNNLIKLCRGNWPDVTDTKIQAEIEKYINLINNNGTKFKADTKENIQFVYQKWLSNQKLTDQEYLIKLYHLFAKMLASSFIAKMDDVETKAHAEIIEKKFDKTSKLFDLDNAITTSQKQFIKKLTTKEKEEALEYSNDKSAFIAIVVGFLGAYLANKLENQINKLNSHSDDDDNNFWSGGSSSSGGFFDDGGSFGGDGGFSGGGGGTDGW